jgi:hypothetical protein
MTSANTLGRRLAAVEGQRSGGAAVRVFMTPRPMDEAQLAAWRAENVGSVRRGETVVVIRRFCTEAPPDACGEIGKRPADLAGRREARAPE